MQTPPEAKEPPVGLHVLRPRPIEGCQCRPEPPRSHELHAETGIVAATWVSAQVRGCARPTVKSIALLPRPGRPEGLFPQQPAGRIQRGPGPDLEAPDRATMSRLSGPPHFAAPASAGWDIPLEATLARGKAPVTARWSVRRFSNGANPRFPSSANVADFARSNVSNTLYSSG